MFPIERNHKPRHKLQQSVTETNQECNDLHGDNSNMDGLDPLQKTLCSSFPQICKVQSEWLLKAKDENENWDKYK